MLQSVENFIKVLKQCFTLFLVQLVSVQCMIRDLVEFRVATVQDADM